MASATTKMMTQQMQMHHRRFFCRDRPLSSAEKALERALLLALSLPLSGSQPDERSGGSPSASHHGGHISI